MLIVRLNQDRPSLGAPKIRERLRRLYPHVHTPAISTVHAVLIATTWSSAAKAGATEPRAPSYPGCGATSGRVCFNRRKSTSDKSSPAKSPHQAVDERTWLATFMHDDPGYFDDGMCRLEPLEKPFGLKVLPMSPE